MNATTEFFRGTKELRFPLDSRLRSISEGDFRKYQRLIHREAGIFLSSAKTALLVGRLSKRVSDLELTSFRDYYNCLCADPAEMVQMLNLVATNETHFFREPQHFQFLESKIIPQWKQEVAAGKRNRRVRVWSAACSTGEEPYALAMVLLAHLPPSAGWEINIQATDISTRVLERAKNGIWPLRKSEEIPHHYRKEFMLKGKGPEEGNMKAGPEVRSVIDFARLNLNDPEYRVIGKFDLIFCRNVLIYFDTSTKTHVVQNLVKRLVSDGYFFVGHAESLHHMSRTIELVGPTVYALAKK